MPSADPSPLILLDTHVWYWVVQGDERIPADLTVVEKAARDHRLMLSAVSLWEIGMLHAKGRISLELDCLTWIQRALIASNIGLAPLSPEIAVESTHLPERFHGDPADRMIVASARILKATLVTKDAAMLEYARHGHFHVIPI